MRFVRNTVLSGSQSPGQAPMPHPGFHAASDDDELAVTEDVMITV